MFFVGLPLTIPFLPPLSTCVRQMHRAGRDDFIKPANILEELPLKIRNPGLINALMYDLQGMKTMNCDFDRLDLSTNPFLEKNLDYLCDWVDELANEQFKFQSYARNTARQRWKRKQENEERRQNGDEPLGDRFVDTCVLLDNFLFPLFPFVSSRYDDRVLLSVVPCAAASPPPILFSPLLYPASTLSGRQNTNLPVWTTCSFRTRSTSTVPRCTTSQALRLGNSSSRDPSTRKLKRGGCLTRTRATKYRVESPVSCRKRQMAPSSTRGP